MNYLARPRTVFRLALAVAGAVVALSSSAETAKVNGVDWEYYVWGDGASIDRVPQSVKGPVSIPSSLGGYKVTEIDWGAFEDCTGIKSVTVPQGVTLIDNNAFRNCTGLASVVIPGTVTVIGWSAFEGCTGLKSVSLSTGLLTIENSAFEGCTGLKSLSLPSSVTSIGWDAFSGCSALSTLNIPKTMTSIGDYAFRDCTGLTKATIPEGVTSIGDGAFDGCTGLSSVTIPEGVTKIGDHAFAECSSLVSIAIPSTVTSIGVGAFSECTGLTSVIIPESVTSVGMHAFFWCSSLESLYLPKRFKDKTSDWAVPSTCQLFFGSQTATRTYTVKFAANGGKLPKGKKMAAQKIAYGKAVKLRKNVFVRTGYVFAGWAKSKKGAVAYANAAKVKNLRAAGKTVTLYAVWARKTYKVAFYANGGKGRMAAQKMTYGKAKKLSANKFTRKGYVFRGWAKSKALAKKGKVAYKNKKSVKNLLKNGKTVKLYAVWKKK